MNRLPPRSFRGLGAVVREQRRRGAHQAPGVPGATDDRLSAVRAWLSELGLSADQLTAVLRSMTDVRVAVLVDSTGMNELSAYELAGSEAARLLSWDGLTEVIFDANEPETVPSGAVQVGVLVGVTTLEPATAVRSACAALADRLWSGPHQRAIPEHQFAWWCADPPPSSGPVRVEVHAAPGLSIVTERQRREMLDDPDLAPLHDLLRPGRDPA